MERFSIPHRPARLLAAVALVMTGLVGLSRSAEARGGWAVTTLDAVSAPLPGETIEVGFTIRQHGVTPVDLDEGVAITIVSADGAKQDFPATTSAVVGHYAARVTFPTAGVFTWTVHQGWFGEQDLGSITIADAAAVAGGDPGRGRGAVRYGVGGAAVLLAGIASVDAVQDRRRRQARVVAA